MSCFAQASTTNYNLGLAHMRTEEQGEDPHWGQQKVLKVRTKLNYFGKMQNQLMRSKVNILRNIYFYTGHLNQTKHTSPGI